ncbi:putative N-acetyltransferase YjcF [Lysinibacillus sp. PLM2]|nr:putative N-acetyltransferase YjcF [Lysinibacillus sp. PLM2]
MYDVKIVETEQQLQSAYEVRNKVFVVEQGVPEHLELDEFDAKSIHFIVNDGEQVVAAARFREYQPKVGKVERVCVLPSYRGKKLGVLMMKAIENYAATHGFQKLLLYAQTHAVPFYEKLNYVINSPEFLDAGIPHRSMEKMI